MSVKEVASRGKTSTGWFFGFKLHLVVNELGELLGCCVTLVNVDDRKPAPRLTVKLVGKLFAAIGYLSQTLITEMGQRGLQLITKIRKNMKNKLMVMMDKLLLGNDQ